mgnify:FL=1
MTSREKVRKLFRHEPTDGIVIDFGCMPSDGMSAFTYAKLVQALGLPPRPARIYDIFQQIVAPDLDVINAMGGDFVMAHRMRVRFGISCREWKQDVLANGSPCLVPGELAPELQPDGSKVIYVDGKPFARMPAGGFYYDQIAHPLESCEELDDLADYEPYRMPPDEIDYICQEVEDLYANTDKGIVFGFGGSIFEQGQRDFNFENFYYNIMEEKELMHLYFRKTTDAYLYNLHEVLSRVGDKIDVVSFFDDLGTQTSLQLSPALYREMIKPYQAELYAAVHSHCPHGMVLLHCCGAIFDAIPDLIDAGVDMLNPVQISARGMDPERLKETFGKEIIFWGGGADLQQFVQKTEDLDAIRAHVEQLIEIFEQNGNYVFSQIHNFQHDVPVEKILAIYEVAKAHKH